jgi:hypothetical protein
MSAEMPALNHGRDVSRVRQTLSHIYLLSQSDGAEEVSKSCGQFRRNGTTNREREVFDGQGRS